MYTRCTHCEAHLRLQTAQLREGLGQVRCGACLQVFNALVHLQDETSEAPLAAPVTADGAAASDRRRFRLLAPEDASAGRDARAPDSAQPDPEVLSAVAAPAPEEPVPAILRDDLERLQRRPRPLCRSAQVLVAALLLLALPAQYAFFEPADLLRRYPSAQPWLAAFCAHSGCRLPLAEQRAHIVMVSRAVRIHPRFEGALQVQAVLRNDAPGPQSHPDVRLTLFNVNGDVIATRRFTPREYLHGQDRPDLPMAPGLAAELRLELLAPEDTAVSFEFEFI